VQHLHKSAYHSVSFYKPVPDLWASRFSWQYIFRLWSSRMWCYGIIKFDVCLSVHHHNMWRRKPTRCYTMLYWTCNVLNMFRACLCPSSRARDCTASMACGV